MTKILITGASGFVGKAFMQRFADHADIDLYGVARRDMPWPNYKSVDLSKGLDIDFVPDVVIHAAAHVSPWGSKQEYRDKNVVATQNVIEFCGCNGRPRLIYLSSSSVYYTDEPQFDLKEDNPIGPDFINEYSASKYAGEKLVEAYDGSHVILRPRAIFGPGDTVLFPRLLVAAKKGRLPLFDSGGDPAIGDLIYIETLCDYLLIAALNTDITGAYNLTNAEAVEFQSLLLSVLERLDLPKPTRHFKVSTAMKLAGALEWIYTTLHITKEPPLTRYGVSVLANSKTFDVTRMLNDFGPPSVSLSEGVDRFVEWQKQNA